MGPAQSVLEANNDSDDLSDLEQLERSQFSVFAFTAKDRIYRRHKSEIVIRPVHLLSQMTSQEQREDRIDQT